MIWGGKERIHRARLGDNNKKKDSTQKECGNSACHSNDFLGSTIKDNDHDLDLGWKVARELLIEASPNDSCRRIELNCDYKVNNI